MISDQFVFDSAVLRVSTYFVFCSNIYSMIYLQALKPDLVNVADNFE